MKVTMMITVITVSMIITKKNCSNLGERLSFIRQGIPHCHEAKRFIVFIAKVNHSTQLLHALDLTYI
jgi:hypothetical protein